ncbi:MAG: TonB-dependent receptor [Pseudomonadales bacterium]
MKKSNILMRNAIATALGLVIGAPAIAQDLILEEIVVTAQKREQSVRDIAATVNVIAGQAIDDFGARDFRDLEDLTAGLSLTTLNARTSTVSLRGISNDPESGSEPGVDLYFNDVLTRPDTAFSQIFDMERIEVLRGPQGVLQGRTSPGGAIVMKTKRPSLESFNGSVMATVGDNDGLNTQLAIGGPIIDGVLGIRIAGVYDEHNGGNVTNAVTGIDSDDEGQAGRISLLFQPSDTFTASLMHQYYERFTNDPKNLDGTDLSGRGFPTLNGTDRTSISPVNDFAKLRYNFTTLDLNLQALGHEFTMVAGHQTSDKFSRTQNDRIGYLSPLDRTQTSHTVLDGTSVELRMSSIDTQNWEYMVGLFYLDQDTTTQFNAASVNAGINFLTTGAIPVNTENLAVFTFHKFHIGDAWTLDVGARWQKRNSFRQAEVNFGGILSLPPAFVPIQAIIENAFAANFPLDGVLPADQRGSSSNVTGMVALNYEFSDDLSGYVSVSTANRADGISISPGPNIADIARTGLLGYDTEDSTMFEVGFKSRLLGGRASLNGSAFYQQFDGYLGRVTGLQIDGFDDPAEDLSDIAGGLVFNGDATVFGVEFDGKFLISENWSMGGTFSYNNAEFDDGATAPCNAREAGEAIGACEIGGTAISGEPEVSLSLNSEFTVPMGSSEWYLRGLLKHKGDRQNQTGSAGTGMVVSEFDATTILNLYTGVRSADGKWDVMLWAKNVTDDDTVLLQEGADSDDIAASGTEFGSYTRVQLQRERSVGLTARYNFGG